MRARLSDDFDLVVAARGEGTVSAVIDGLIGSSVPPGIIPAVTGNLIVYELNIPLEIEDAATLIECAYKFRMIDTIRIAKRVRELWQRRFYPNQSI